MKTVLLHLLGPLKSIRVVNYDSHQLIRPSDRFVLLDVIEASVEVVQSHPFHRVMVGLVDLVVKVVLPHLPVHPVPVVLPLLRRLHVVLPSIRLLPESIAAVV